MLPALFFFLRIALDSMATSTIRILPFPEHRLSFHFFESSSVSFINILEFSAYKSFTSLVRFIPKFFVFGAIFKGVGNLSFKI